MANSTPFGLGAGVWTGDVSRAHRVAQALRTGITWINDYHRTDPASPWGGFGLSGLGRENGFAAAEMFAGHPATHAVTGKERSTSEPAGRHERQSSTCNGSISPQRSPRHARDPWR
jgi:acyl-CoA reductase-like NAD-dependent aldehyde dehydrogenase